MAESPGGQINLSDKRTEFRLFMGNVFSCDIMRTEQMGEQEKLYASIRDRSGNGALWIRDC